MHLASLRICTPAMHRERLAQATVGARGQGHCVPENKSCNSVLSNTCTKTLNGTGVDAGLFYVQTASR